MISDFFIALSLEAPTDVLGIIKVGLDQIILDYQDFESKLLNDASLNDKKLMTNKQYSDSRIVLALLAILHTDAAPFEETFTIVISIVSDDL